MKKLLVGICVAALLVTGCGSKGEQQREGSVEAARRVGSSKTDAQSSSRRGQAQGRKRAGSGRRPPSDKRKQEEEARKAGSSRWCARCPIRA